MEPSAEYESPLSWEREEFVAEYHYQHSASGVLKNVEAPALLVSQYLAVPHMGSMRLYIE